MSMKTRDLETYMVKRPLIYTDGGAKSVNQRKDKEREQSGHYIC